MFCHFSWLLNPCICMNVINCCCSKGMLIPLFKMPVFCLSLKIFIQFMRYDCVEVNNKVLIGKMKTLIIRFRKKLVFSKKNYFFRYILCYIGVIPSHIILKPIFIYVENMKNMFVYSRPLVLHLSLNSTSFCFFHCGCCLCDDGTAQWNISLMDGTKANAQMHRHTRKILIKNTIWSPNSIYSHW